MTLSLIRYGGTLLTLLVLSLLFSGCITRVPPGSGICSRRKKCS
ncbi:MAG: hypothetical protein MPW15_27385 [Candidatus Manganitrophus sp.]|nr:hypothetical protein [Candidatus Manganitrophus sp.]